MSVNPNTVLAQAFVALVEEYNANLPHIAALANQQTAIATQQTNLTAQAAALTAQATALASQQSAITTELKAIMAQNQTFSIVPSPQVSGALVSEFPSGVIPSLTIANIGNMNGGSAFTQDLSKYLTGVFTSLSLVVVSGTLAGTGYAFSTPTLSFTPPGGSPAPVSVQLVASNGVVNVTSNVFTLSSTQALAADTLAPTIPTGFMVSTGQSNVLTWDASSDPVIAGSRPSGVKQYIVTRDANTNFATVSSPGPGLANQFTYGDIGAVGIAGSATQAANGTDWSITAAGSDIYSNPAAFGFLSTPVTAVAGLVTSIVKITNFVATMTYAKAALLFMQTLTPSSPYVELCYQAGTNGAVGGLNLLSVATAGATPLSTFLNMAAIPSVSTPLWLKLTWMQSTGVFNAYWSLDGNAWTLLGTVTVAMPTSIFTGLGVCSHNVAAPITVSFAQLNVQNLPQLTFTDTAGGGHTYSVLAQDVAVNPSANCASQTSQAPASGFGIKIVGNVFTDLAGNPVILKGVNFAGMEIGSATGAFSGTSIATWKAIAAKWGLNIFRFPLNESSWNNNTNGYRAGVMTAVNNATAAGVYVILDLHWSGCSTFNGGIANGQANLVSQDTGVTFWTSVANTFRNNPAVLFEMHNEPYGQGVGDTSTLYQGYLKSGSGNTQITLYNAAGGNFGGTSTGALFKAAGNQGILNAIRGTGATNVTLYGVLVLNSAFSESLNVKPTDPLNQLGATVHYANGSSGDYTNVLNANIPIVITEAYTTKNLNGGSNGLTGFIWPHKIGVVLWTPASGPNDAYVSGGLGSVKTDFSGALNLAPWNSQGSNGTLDNLQTGADGTHGQSG